MNCIFGLFDVLGFTSFCENCDWLRAERVLKVMDDFETEIHEILLHRDTQKCGTVFGFFQFPATLYDLNGKPVVTTHQGDRWTFQNFVSSADPRFRQIVRRFADAGYLDAERDEFTGKMLP